MPTSPSEATYEAINETELTSELTDELTEDKLTSELLAELTSPVNTPEASALDEVARLRAEEKAKIINRLRRLEGQVRGLQRMVEEERSCQEVLTLLSGVRSALNATADRVLVNYLEHCKVDIASGEADMQELVKAVKLARG